MGAVKFLGLKKRSRLYLGNLYIVLTISLIAGSVAKRYVTNQHKLWFFDTHLFLEPLSFLYADWSGRKLMECLEKSSVMK